MSDATASSPNISAAATTAAARGSLAIPALRYADARRMIDWLCTALGFTRKAVYDWPDGTVAHAELLFGETGMIMLGSVRPDGDFAAHMVQPSEIGGRETMRAYLVTPDAAALFAQATAAGAEVVVELRTMEYGGAAFAVRDPEGHLWSVGEYSPWTAS